MVNHRRGGGNLGVMLLAAQMMNMGLEHIPPVTLALVVGQAAIFLDLFPRQFPSPHAICMSSYLVYEHHDWQRMILAAFYHASDMHLYFNMVSLLYKGITLERRFGSPYFAYLVAVFTPLTSIVYVGLGIALSQLLGDQSYLTSCAVGFSGVLFALKVVTTEYSPPGVQYAFGFIPVPSKYMFWAELVLIQLVTPNASFIGHLAGILVGLAYTRGPLKILMDAFLRPGEPGSSRGGSASGSRASSPFSSFTNLFGGRPRFHQGRRPHSPSYFGGSAAPSAPYEGSDGWRNGAHNTQPSAPGYQDYTGGLDEDEQLRRAMEESRRQNLPHSSGSSSQQRLYPDLQDLRTRRAHYYQ
ncbi:rhomboid-related protein 4 [Aplysia californica]|uniref:Rhomboid-related protein 4 n=1 Tax=Aplysia californica TaxID=6500 RepID=A0ABM0K0Q0_APLCA|nr:rhomboid-related protein 4 [Aplysia californica]XP_005106016.1 rhomboid-related protein 4 [Aplysia californica]